MTYMKPYIANMLTLLPEEFDSALLGYAESGSGRAIVLPVYDRDMLEDIMHKKAYTMEQMATWEAWNDPPLLLKRMTNELATEQNSIFGFQMLKKYGDALLGAVGTWHGEECFLYDMSIASGDNEYARNRILNNDLPGHDVCFLMGTTDDELELIKEKAARYSYEDDEDFDIPFMALDPIS